MTVVAFQRVVCADSLGPRGRARGRLAGVDLFLTSGVHAVLGTPEDGTLALVEVLAGVHEPIAGALFVAGEAPSKHAATRRRIGVLGPVPRLAPASSVLTSVALALSARGEPKERAAALLDEGGVGPLRARRPESLSYAEARAVELVLCLSTPSPTLLVLHEPLADVALPGLDTVADRLRDHARAGACVVLTTSSPHDARTLGDAVYLLDRGRFVRAAPGEGAAWAPGQRVPISAWIEGTEGSGVRELSALLAQRSEIAELTWEAGAAGSGVIHAAGDDVDAVALAIAEVASEAHIHVAALRSLTPSLAEARAAMVPTFHPMGARRM